MQSSDRLHALDAVRACALLLGIALHAAQPFVAGLGWPTMESPNRLLAGIWYTIHMFRMPLFFLIAGFFGRMMLERRGLSGFVKDRLRRILVPLLVGLPVVMLVTGLAYVLGSLAAGVDPRGLQGMHPPGPPPHQSLLQRINLIHLWFLYYLLIFYAAAVMLRVALQRSARVQAGTDAVMRFLLRGFGRPAILALPVAAYYFTLESWSSWGGLPAPFSLIPDTGALIGYGLFFGFGWLLQRQQPLLSGLEQRWALYCTFAVALSVACRIVGGTTPHWGHYLGHAALAVYTTCYTVGMWTSCLGLIGLALRFLSGYSPVRRYLADASYWMYLMHIPALFFFGQLLHPLHWAGELKYVLSIAGAVALLLLSYHSLVRFTFVGATLNGRRHPRAAAESQGVATQG